VLGVLRVDHGEQDYFDPERERLLAAVASQTALAIRHANLLAQQRDLAVTTERNRIARDLHDAVSQTLFAANLLAGTLARTDTLDEATRGQVQTLERLNRSALAEMRMMLFELQPETMSDVRLPELLHQAVEALAGRGGVEITTDMDDSAPLGPSQRCEVYRIATALLSNIARHSRASHVHLQWSTPLQGPAVLRVCDDGCGFVAETAELHDSGVARIRKLASSLGAILVINSAPGEGTEVTLTFHRSPHES
jgi:signal transduction histidine kinase